MGEQIVESLTSSDDRHPGEPDLLSRWVSHEIASAIREVNKARSAAARQRAVTHATELILRVWEHRTSWPSGWPPDSARARFQAIQDPTHYSRPPKSGSLWIDQLLDQMALSSEEARLWLKLGLLEQGVEEERALLEALPSTENENLDVETLKRSVELHDQGALWLETNDAGTKARAKELVEKELRRIASSRRKLQRKALAKMKSPRSAHRKKRG